MVALRSLVARLVPAAAVLAAAAAGGCAGTRTLHTAYADARHAVGLSPAARPVTQVIQGWEPKLKPLADPTRDGQQTLGLAGQVFLIGADDAPADAAGDVTFTVYDQTPRPPGAAERTPEVWHFDRATFARMRTTDERFRQCYVAFLPWPADWGTAVTHVRIAARYQAADKSADLTAADVLLPLDHTGQGGAVRQNADLRGVPDPARLIRDIQANGYRPAVTGPAPNQAVPAGGIQAVPIRVAEPVVAPAAPVRVPQQATAAPAGWQSDRAISAVPLSPAAMQPPAAAASVPPPAGPAGMVPRNTVNSPFQTEGAWAGPKPVPERRPAPVVLPDGAIQPIIVPVPGGSGV